MCNWSEHKSCFSNGPQKMLLYNQQLFKIVKVMVVNCPLSLNKWINFELSNASCMPICQLDLSFDLSQTFTKKIYTDILKTTRQKINLRLLVAAK